MNKLPKWVEDEINSITEESFKMIDRWSGTGYFLDIDQLKRRVDIQFYEKLPIGRYIVTAEVPDNLSIDKFMKGYVYTYTIKILKAEISERLRKYLKENLNIDLECLYRVVLESVELLDDVSEVSSDEVEDESKLKLD